MPKQKKKSKNNVKRVKCIQCNKKFPEVMMWMFNICEDCHEDDIFAQEDLYRELQDEFYK